MCQFSLFYRHVWNIHAMFDQLAWKEAAFLNEFFLRVMGNKHTAGELTTFAFGTLPMCRDESVRNVPWSQRLFTISQIMFSPSLHMFMHKAEVRHFFNCSPLNDETIGKTERLHCAASIGSNDISFRWICESFLWLFLAFFLLLCLLSMPLDNF